MITIETDKEILANAYKQYIYCIKKKKIHNLTPLEIRHDLTKDADATIKLLSNSRGTADSIRKALISGKNVYGQYCQIVKGTPGVHTPELKEKMDALANLMADHEARYVHLLRSKNLGIADVSLRKLYKSPQNIITICNDTSWNTLQAFLFGLIKEPKKSKKEKKDPVNVYITSYGNKYHRLGCRYCKGKELKEIYFEAAVSDGYSKCSCIASSTNLKPLQEAPFNAEKTNYMTAFIDESLRDNPWYKYDNSLEQKQLSYSYIICQGYLRSENEISTENILYRKAVLSDYRTIKIERGAFEAISKVMMILAFDMGFHSNVVIYTDSENAAKQWQAIPANKGLSRLFSNVQVVQISRQRNLKADAAGRERALLNVPKATMLEIDKLIAKGMQASEELDIVHHYFKDPVNDIPRLVTRLIEIVGTDISDIYIPRDNPSGDKSGIIDKLIDHIKSNKEQDNILSSHLSDFPGFPASNDKVGV